MDKPFNHLLTSYMSNFDILPSTQQITEKLNIPMHILHFQKQLQSCPWLLAQCHCHQVQTIPSFFSLLTKMFVDYDNDHHRHRHSSAGDDKADL